MKTKYGSLPFDAQIAFFKRKLALPTRSWTDVIHGHHDHAFVVAGANKQAIVEDFQKSVRLAIEDGTTLAAFRKDFDRIVKEHGWDYKGSRGWRSRVIYETNLSTSYHAGRYTQLQKMEFWQYHHSSASENPRQKHVAWDGLILPKDDPFWSTNYPPNGWGCKCTVTGHSKAAMQRKGLKPSDSPKLKMERVEIGKNGPNPRFVDVPKGVGPGWAYAPGRDAWIHGHALPPMGAAKNFSGLPRIPAFPAEDNMPNPRPFPKKKLLQPMQAGQEEKYVNAFLEQFGAKIGKPSVFTDAVGEPVVISEDLFKVGRDWKVGQRGRDQKLLMLAETIKNPDEIWTWMEWHTEQQKAVATRAYLARHIINDRPEAAIVVLRRDGWQGVTAHTSKSASEKNDKIAKNRIGIRLFKRGE